VSAMRLTKNKVLIALIGAIIVVFFKIHSESSSARTGPQTAAGIDEAFLRSGRGACREYVKRSLNDPGSAEWEPGSNWLAKRTSSDTAHIEPRLRAKNAFGGLILVEFSCDVRLSAGDWHLVNLVQK
jgi:hypothetical protein